MTYNILKKKLNKKEILNTNQMTNLLTKYHTISKNSKSMYYLNNNILPVKIGNDKIGKDTLIINMSTCLNCYSFKMGYCNAKKCYGRSIQEFRMNSLLYGMSCEINWNKLTHNEINKQLDKQITYDINFLRFNEFGEMKNINDFNKANNIATYVKNKYDVTSYIYTANQDLNIDTLLDSNITVNFSYDTGRSDTKECKIIEKTEIKECFKDENRILCDGECLYCPYCKNKNELREIDFTKHGNGEKISKILRKILTPKELNELKAQKLIDYGLFLKNKS